MNYPTAHLEEVLSLCDSGEWGDDSINGGGIPVLRVADVKGGNRISYETAPLRQVAQRKRLSKTLKNGDIVVVKSSGSATNVVSGRAALVTGVEDNQYGFANFLLRLRVNEARYNPRFLIHVLNSQLVREQVLTMVAALTYPNLSVPSYKRLVIPCPALPEQQRIVGILDKAFEAIATAKANAEKNLQAAKALVTVAFTAIVDSFDASNWKTVTVEQVADPTKGSMRTGPFGSQLLHSEFVDEGIPVLGIDNAVENQFAWKERRYITARKFKELSRYQVKPGDVLITIMGTCGRCAIVPEDIPTAINSKHLCCITLDFKKCLPAYLHAYFLYHPRAQEFLAKQAKGAIMSGLNMGIIKKVPLILPPVAEQQKIIEKFSAAEVGAASLASTYQAKGVALDDLKKSVLHQAFSGQL